MYSWETSDAFGRAIFQDTFWGTTSDMLTLFYETNVKQLLNQQYTKTQLSQNNYWESFKIIDEI